ncbi:MAG TPA: YqhA family protein, partial [Burkholderiales bacterium]
MKSTDDGHDSYFAKAIGRSRMIVIVAVIAVLLAAFSLFLLGAVIALETIYTSWHGVLAGNLGPTDLTVRFLEIV